jgi:hypothetical protein
MIKDRQTLVTKVSKVDILMTQFEKKLQDYIPYTKDKQSTDIKKCIFKHPKFPVLGEDFGSKLRRI